MPRKKGNPVKTGMRTKTKRVILSPSTRQTEPSRAEVRAALHDRRVNEMIQLGYNSRADGRRDRDPLGIMTPANQRGYFYSMSGGRTADGDPVPSRQQQEEVAMKEVYFSNSDDERDYQLALEIEDVSDLSDGIDYNSGDDEFKVEMGETLPPSHHINKPSKIKPAKRPPSRRPPTRPDRLEAEYKVKTTEKPEVKFAVPSDLLEDYRPGSVELPYTGNDLISGSPISKIIFEEWEKRNQRRIQSQPTRVELPRTINMSDFISGSNFNRPVQTIQDSDGVPKAYEDHIVPESQISQSAHDREEFIGANPREMTSEIVNGIDRLRDEEYKHDVDRVRDVVQEVEVLSGMNNDSLMNGTDLVDNSGSGEEGKYDDYRDSNMRGHPRSGVTRGREARTVQEVNLENMEESLRDFFDEEGEGGAPLSDDIQNIGQRFGQAIDSVRGFSGGLSDVSSIISEPTSGIMDSISGLTSLSSDTGSWYSKDSDLDDNIEVSDRMSEINRVPMNKDMREAVGKFNPMVNAGNSLMMSQGVSLGTINEMRKNEVKYKQPNRKFKNNAVDLVRLGNRTKIMLDNEYAP